MAISNQASPIPADVTQDWRESWSSEADITTGEPQRAPPPPGIFTPTPDAVASALDEFLTEAPLVAVQPPPAPVLRPTPTPRPVTVHYAPVRDRRHLRSLVLGAAVAAVFLAALVIGFRESPVPAGDIVGPPVSPAPPAATAAPPQRMAARSPELAAGLQVSRAQGPAPVSTPDRSGPPPVRAPRAEPPPTSAARPTPPALNTAPPPARSSLARRGGIPSNDGVVLRSSAPALGIATRDPFVAPGAPAPLRPAPAAVNEPVSSTPETAPAPEPPPTTVKPAETAAAAPAALTDRQAIQVVLGQYQAAFSRLDANGVRAIWPGLNAAALERAFGQMERQAVAFSGCSVTIIGVGATARCQGSASYVPKVGNRTERIDHRQWQIDLRKTGDNWRIVAVDSRE